MLENPLCPLDLPIKSTKLSLNEGETSVISSRRVVDITNRITTDTFNTQVEENAIINSKERNKNEENTINIRLAQWNPRSLNTREKIDYIIGIDADIFALQEVWQRDTEVENLPFEIISKTTRLLERGGGTATLAKDHLRCRSVQNFEINKDMRAVKLRIAQGFWCWLINVYVHDGSIKKVQKIFAKIRKDIPQEEWGICCLIGDFNINMNIENQNSQLLKSLAKQMGWKVYLPNGNTCNSKTKIDYIIAGNHVRIKTHKTLCSLSDHKSVIWDINLLCPRKSRKSAIPDRKQAENHTRKVMMNRKNQNAQAVLRQLQELRNHNGIKTRPISQKQRRNEDLLKLLIALDDHVYVKDVVNNYWRDWWVKVEETRFTVDSKESYNNLRRMLK